MKRRTNCSINLIFYTKSWMKASNDWKTILYYN
jgi:hypothetical protein